MAWTLCVSAAAIRKAGLNANSDIVVSEAAMLGFSDEAEARINAETKRDWVAVYSTVGTNFQNALGAAASSAVAIDIINYDMSGYTRKREAETMLDVNRDIYRIQIAYLKELDHQKKMGV